MAIFMTLLGKYSTRSHQWEGELWQGDKMEAVIYLGALGWWMRHQPCTEEGSRGRASTLHPGLHVLRLQRRVVNAGLSEALSAHHHPPSPSFMKHSCICSIPGNISSSRGRVTGIRKTKGDVWAQGEEVRGSLRVLKGTCRPHQASWPEEQQAKRAGRRKTSPLSPRKLTGKKVPGDYALCCLTLQLAKAHAWSAGKYGKSRKTKSMLPAVTFQFCGPHQFFMVLSIIKSLWLIISTSSISGLESTGVAFAS